MFAVQGSFVSIFKIRLSGVSFDFEIRLSGVSFDFEVRPSGVLFDSFELDFVIRSLSNSILTGDGTGRYSCSTRFRPNILFGKGSDSFWFDSFHRVSLPEVIQSENYLRLAYN